MTCDRSLELGGYVLHALEEHEEHAVEQHLVDCDDCLEELGELALTASLLALVRPEDTETADDPAAMTGRRAGRLRRRTALAAAAAVAIGMVAASPAVHLLDSHDPSPQAVVLHGTGTTSRVRGEVSIVARDGGAGLHLSLAGAPRHGWCSLVARAADGRSEIAATWPADGLGRVDVSGTTAIPAAQLSELSVVTDTGRRLLDIPVHPNP
jgi:hypothetical protein